MNTDEATSNIVEYACFARSWSSDPKMLTYSFNNFIRDSIFLK